MKRVIALACFMLILTLTNCSHSVVQVDEVESEATEESGNIEEVIEETIIDEESSDEEIVIEIVDDYENEEIITEYSEKEIIIEIEICVAGRKGATVKLEPIKDLITLSEEDEELNKIIEGLWYFGAMVYGGKSLKQWDQYCNFCAAPDCSGCALVQMDYTGKKASITMYAFTQPYKI